LLIARLGVAAVSLAAAAALTSTASGEPMGALKAPASGASCFKDPAALANYTSCPSTANGLQGAITAVVSPDGKDVYVASFQADAVASFSRDRDTGALEPLPGAAACMKDRDSVAGARCGTQAIGIKTPIGLAISPDGKNVYVAGVGSDAVAAFSRDPDTGVLTQLSGSAACIRNVKAASDNPCTATGNGLGGTRWVTVSPDGRNVYTATAAGHAVAAFSRDAKTGALTQLPGAAACIEDVNDNEAGSGIPDGNFKSSCGQTANGLSYPRTITISPDGRNAYAATDFGGAIAEFRRDPATGALTQLGGADSCIEDTVNAPSYTDCPSSAPSLNWVWSVAVAPDGRNAYSGSDEGAAITAFSRDAKTGALHRLPGAAACIREWNAPTSTQCAVSGNGLSGAEDVTISPNGHTVYVAAFHGMAVSAFSRDPDSGALTQLPGRAGCVEDLRAPQHTSTRCKARADGLYQPRIAALSPDGRNAYVPTSVGSTVAVLSLSTKGPVLRAKAPAASGGSGWSATATAIGIGLAGLLLLGGAAVLLNSYRRSRRRRRARPGRIRRHYTRR
jgi:6-phosphogluconolactonase (cycloisomerase 2 family)